MANKDDPNRRSSSPSGSVADKNSSVIIGGEVHYSLRNTTTELNPCAGQLDGTSCGRGCTCLGGQCYYTLERLQEMGVRIE